MINFGFTIQIYDYIIRIPDLLRGIFLHGEMGTHTYDVVTQACIAQYGNPDYCRQIVLWRAIIHLVGCLGFILIFLFLSKKGYKKLSFYFCILFIFFILIQEIIIHPLYYGQIWQKGVIDIVTWCLPLGLFLYREFR